MWRPAIIAAIVCSSTPAWSRTALDVEVEVRPGVGIRSAIVRRVDEGVLVSGAVCREGFSAGRPRFVRLDRVSASGATLETTWAPLRASPGYRGGCTPYRVGSSALRQGERARLSVHRTRR